MLPLGIMQTTLDVSGLNLSSTEFRFKLGAALSALPIAQEEIVVGPAIRTSRNTIIFRCRHGAERWIAKVQETKPSEVVANEYRVLHELAELVPPRGIRTLTPVAFLDDLGVVVTVEEPGEALSDVVRRATSGSTQDWKKARVAVVRAAEALRWFHDAAPGRRGSAVRQYLDFSPKNILVRWVPEGQGGPELVLLDPPEEERSGGRTADIGLFCYDLNRLRFAPCLVGKPGAIRRIDRLKADFLTAYGGIGTASLAQVRMAERTRGLQALRWYARPWRFSSPLRETLRLCYMGPLTLLYLAIGLPLSYRRVSRTLEEASSGRGVPAESAADRTLLMVVNHLGFFLSHRAGLAKAAYDAGWKIHVATPEDGRREQHLADYIHYHRIPLTRSGRRPLREIRSIISLYRLYRNVRPTIVHHVTVKPMLYGGLAARLVRIHGVVAAVSGLGWVSTESARRPVVRLLVERLYRLALGHPNCRVIFQNADDRAALLQIGAVRNGQAVLIRGSGVDATEIHQSAEPAGMPTVLMTARLLREKGVLDYAEAARLVRAEVPARFLLAGGLDLVSPSALRAEELESWVEDGSIEWLGHRNDIGDLLNTCHIFAFPSYYGEGIPRSLIEAAAAGRPIVTTDMPGCREVVSHGENGLLVPPRNPRALADAILALIRDETARSNMGVRSRQRFEREFTLAQVVEAHMKVYEQLATYSQ